MNALVPGELIGLTTNMLDRLLPMHLIIAPTGHIKHAGPTLKKLRPSGGFRGQRFLEVFELRRPRGISQTRDLWNYSPGSLTLRLRDHETVPLKGVSIPLPDQNSLLIHLSFGIAAAEAVTQFALSAKDFSATDLTIEMLYLVEANNAVMIESRSLINRLHGAKLAAEEQAFSDTLTGLKNRRALDLVLSRMRSSQEGFALMHLDLDYFKQVNDTLGHAAGDHVLQETARVLLDETRDADSIIRFGGDEFVLIFPDFTCDERLAKVAKRILKRLEQPIPFEGDICKISGSVGIAISNDYAEADPDEMLIDADIALYASKNAGRAQHMFARDIEGTSAAKARELAR